MKRTSNSPRNREQFKTKKSLGQNFIMDEGILSEIADISEIGPDDYVLEIGTGLGTLTKQLADRAAHVVTIEIDDSLIPILNVSFSGIDNITLIHGNALKLDIREIMLRYSPFHVVANIPYYLTTDLLNILLLKDLPIKSVNVMVQKEAAERIVAGPGDDAYGMLAVRTRLRGNAEIMLEVPAAMFNPPPKCDSAFVRIVYEQENGYSAEERSLINKVSSAIFLMRRKTLLNNLCSSFHLSREAALEILTQCGLDDRVRGETLDVPTFLQIAKLL